MNQPGDLMTTRDNDVEQMCAGLRKFLAETRHLDRRDFITALGRTVAGSALMTAFAGTPLFGAAGEGMKSAVEWLYESGN